MAHRKFFDSIASQWNEKEHGGDPMARFIERLQLQSGESILDVGAGTGQLSLVLSHWTERPALVYILDSAQQMLYYARQKQYGCQAVFILADAHCLPLEKASINHVVCFQVFPHLLAPAQALSEFYRVLRLNGKITIAHQTGSNQVNAIHSRMGWPVARDFLPGAAIMAQLLTRAGFQLLVAEESDSIYFVQAQKQTGGTGGFIG